MVEALKLKPVQAKKLLKRIAAAPAATAEQRASFFSKLEADAFAMLDEHLKQQQQQQQHGKHADGKAKGLGKAAADGRGAGRRRGGGGRGGGLSAAAREVARLAALKAALAENVDAAKDSPVVKEVRALRDRLDKAARQAKKASGSGRLAS